MKRGFEIIDSVGIELEFSNINREDTKFLTDMKKFLPGFQVKHDASCESKVLTFAGQEVEANAKTLKQMAPYFLNTVIGGEVASPVIDSCSPEWVDNIFSLCELLRQHGELEDTVRDSFHVHVNISEQAPLFVLKNLLKLSAAYEAVMFRLGGMGRNNRGEENFFCYQRPYLGNGPPVVMIGKENYPILCYEDLMQSKDKEEFFGRYGDSYYHFDHRARYVTQRYMVTNFYSILSMGSFEFRTANKTLNPRYIIAWTNFCKAFVQKAWVGPSLLDEITFEMPLYKGNVISMDEFLNALKFLPLLEPSTIDILLEIWESSPTPRFDNKWRYTHLRDPTKFSTIMYAPHTISGKIEKPVFEDIHNQVPEIRVPVEELGIGIEWDAPVVNINNENQREVIQDRLWNVSFNGGNQFYDIRGLMDFAVIDNHIMYGPISYNDIIFYIEMRLRVNDAGRVFLYSWQHRDNIDVEGQFEMFGMHINFPDAYNRVTDYIQDVWPEFYEENM